MIQIDSSDVIFSNQTSVNVSFSSAFLSIPSITATPSLGSLNLRNIEIFISNLTASGCTINTSAPFTGTVKVIAVRG